MDHRDAFTIVAWLSGPLVWAAYFLLVYASESIACRYSGASAHAWLVAVSTVAALSVILVTAHLTRPRGGSGAEAAFMRSTGIVMSALAAAAVIWTAIPGVFLDACLSPT